MTAPVEIVLDANVALSFVNPTADFHEQAVRMMLDFAQAETKMLAPPFFASEVDSAVRKAVRAKDITARRAEELHAILDDLPVELLYPPAIRILARDFAERVGQANVYDATYVALAHLRGCDLWTADKRMWNGAQDAGIGWVRFLGDY